MALADINGEDHLVQQAFADRQRYKHGWDGIYANNDLWTTWQAKSRKRNGEL